MKAVKFSRSPLLSERLPPWRQRFVLVLLLGAFATLIGRAVYLQGFKNEFLGDKGRARFERVYRSTRCGQNIRAGPPGAGT